MHFYFEIALILRMQRKYILIAGGVLALIVLTVGVLDYSGYVLSGPYIIKGGTLVIEDVPAETKVFIDNKKRKETGASETSVSIRGIAPGIHDIIVANDRTWPWISEFEASSAQTSTIYPVFVPRDPNGSVVTKDDPRFDEMRNALGSYQLPTQDEPLIHEANGTELWVDDGVVFSRQANQIDELTTTVFTSQFPIRSIAWYKGRVDVLLIASSDSIFAVDARESDIRNFLPVYRGVSPSFAVNPDNSTELFVDDGGHTLILYLELRGEEDGDTAH